MVALQLPVAIDFQFQRTRFPSRIPKQPESPSDTIGLSSHWCPSGLSDRTIIGAPTNSLMIQSTEFNGLSETLMLISSGSFSRFIGAISKHLKLYQHFSRAQAEHVRLSSSPVFMTSLPSQHDSCAEIDIIE
eukprot:scaffold16276_cov49-Cyclotella_meneghiniana.AAC.8